MNEHSERRENSNRERTDQRNNQRTDQRSDQRGGRRRRRKSRRRVERPVSGARTDLLASSKPTGSDHDANGLPAPTGLNAKAAEHTHFHSVEEAPYAVLSIQASGIHPATSRLLSLAVLTASSTGEIVDTWHVVIDSGEDPGPAHLHGLLPEDFTGAPRFGVILAKLGKALNGRTLITHNAAMNWGFIVEESRRARRQANRENRKKRPVRGRRQHRRVGRIPAPVAVIDTLETARRQGTPLPDTRLRGVARTYGIECAAPTASIENLQVTEMTRTLDDASTTLSLFTAQGGFTGATTIALAATEELKADRVGLQRSVVRVDAMDAPRPLANPGKYEPGKKLAAGMEFAVAPEVTQNPDELISAGVAAGLAYSEKVTRETSLLVCNRPADVTPEQLTGKAMHAHRKEIPLVSDVAFLRLVGEV